MKYPEEFKFDKKDYMVLCGEKVEAYAKKIGIDAKELSPSERKNLERLICKEKVR